MGSWMEGELDGKLCITLHALCGIYIYMCVCYCTFVIRRVHGKFYGLGEKKEMVVLENTP